MPDLPTTNLTLGIATVLIQLGIIKMLVGLTTKGWFAALMDKWIRSYGITFAFVTALLASLMTLYYSEYLSVEPCGLCWLERSLLYPQVILLAVAMWRRDAGIWIYGTALSAVGAVIALYHHYLQLGGADLFPCPAVQTAVNCADKTFLVFGYITFPLAAFSLFIYLILIMLLVKRSHSI